MKESAQILIVDDTELNIILLNQILLNAGYRVLTANGGKKCLEILEKELPDIILLDVIMPELNGFDVAQKIKGNDRTKNIPILFISAVSDFDTKIKGLEQGAVDYITKPYDDREIIARIEIHLKIKALEKEKINYIEELEKLNSEKDNLLQVMAHDIRSPLTSIMMMSEFLMDPNRTLELEKVKKYSSTIYNSSQKILLLINQLMQSIRTEVAKVDLTKFDLVPLVNHSIDLLSRSLEKKSIQLETKFEQDSIFVYLDESKLDQILNNILYNAIKFTNQNGFIQVHVERKEMDSKKVLLISITDNGIGIPKNVLSNIFNKKFIAHREGTQGEEGTGLGLSITNNLMTKLKGKIEIESEVGLGTTVHLYFYNY